MKFEYAIIVKNKTRLESLIERFNTKAQAKFYIERLGGNFDDYEAEHETFHKSLLSLQTQLSKLIKNKTVERFFLPSFIFSEKNLIVVIGQDGLVANTAKYSKNCPIIAVNPDKERYDGILLPFDAYNFVEGVESVITNRYNTKTVRFAEAKMNDGQRLLAFNDLFIGVSSHTSARYKIQYNNQKEEQSSSGLIVSTQAGSTGWLSSVFNMAYGVTNFFEKSLKPQRPKLKDDELLFAVREPFQSLKTQIGITAGIINCRQNLSIESLIPANGVIFSDGVETDFLKFNSGSIATIGIADETAKLVLKPSQLNRLQKEKPNEVLLRTKPTKTTKPAESADIPDLFIAGTPKTPSINFKKTSDGIKMEIKGRCIPENSIDFFGVLNRWISFYENKVTNVCVNMQLEYYNTSSNKGIVDLLFRQLEKMHQLGANVTVNWFVDEDDEDMTEIGLDLGSIFRFPVKIIEVTSW